MPCQHSRSGSSITRIGPAALLKIAYYSYYIQLAVRNQSIFVFFCILFGLLRSLFIDFLERN
ncbi:hypothetical protein CLOSTMETH_01561 [[Clostridium] methylpentosum DSM 5476]|uniref:Uncharacterized protein n=1 Tax=[Clostridium] methylpentosum DSM 5476 TaxID=537013 RepID=C0ECJ0_9FIRM|nr:hypothetical protein CLOSTMETH_01561 [[Clostridium] methylpentosum DSM 5476]